jgi:hypothetical protein
MALAPAFRKRRDRHGPACVPRRLAPDWVVARFRKPGAIGVAHGIPMPFFAPRYNIAPTQLTPVMMSLNTAPDSPSDT